MTNLSTITALLGAVLIGITAGSAWPEEAASSGPAATAMRSPAPATGTVPGWYPPPYPGWYPPPYPGGYAQPWQLPPQWAAPPHGYYSQLPPLYPPQEQYRPAPAAPVAEEKPHGVELEQAQAALTATRAERDKTRETLAQYRQKLQQTLETERALEEQVADLTREQQALQSRVAELSTTLDTTTATLELSRQRNRNDQQQQRALNAARDRLQGELAGRDQTLAAVKAELQAAMQALQQARAETAAAGEQLDAARAQAESAGSELTGLRAELQRRKAAQLETKQTLATVIDERNGLIADLAAMAAQRDALQTDLAASSRMKPARQDDLTDAQAELDTQRRTRAAIADIIAPPAADEPDEAGVTTAADADTDGDGVADRIDLCPSTSPVDTVESTGCAPDAAIDLEGVNFLYNSHELTQEARGRLDRVAGIIHQHPDLRLEVAGHTDASGDPSYNQWLSLQRAEAVRDYLVAQGVNPDHINAAGYGGQRPLADNLTLEGLRKNRRVELRRQR